MKQVKTIGFFSPLPGVGTDCGYGYAAVELITGWQRMGIPVWSFDREADVIFNFGQPHYYERVEGKLNIGYTPWESSAVPKSWLMYMNRMDEIWTTCFENAKWYKDAGVSVPIRVLHHGMNREHFPNTMRSLSPTEPFKFLHIGEPSPRKGGEMIYECFTDVFGGHKGVELILKGKPRFDVETSNVTVIREKLTQDELRELYLECHAMIYPTNGEGFGFIPFQGAASGMPTAVTDWSAPQDYMAHCFPIEVEKLVVPFYEPHEGLWAQPSYDSVCDWLQRFREHPYAYFEEAHRKSAAMDAYWTWDNIAKIAVEWMTDSLNSLP